MPQYGIADVLEDQKKLQALYDKYLEGVADVKDKYGDNFLRVTIDKIGHGKEKVNLNTRLR